MPLTLNERERLAYTSGNTELAAILAEAEDQAAAQLADARDDGYQEGYDKGYEDATGSLSD